jgi:hypothetical protein
VGAEAVVVETEVLQGHVRCQERHERRLRVKAEGVVVEVDCVEAREVENRGKKGGKGLGDFAEQAAGEDVGEVGDLGEQEGQGT